MVYMRGYSLKVWSVTGYPNLLVADAVKKDIESLKDDDAAWTVVHQALDIVKWFRANYWLLSSLFSDMWGTAIRGGTHGKRYSIDLALIRRMEGELLKSKDTSPSLDTRMEALCFLAQKSLRCGVFAEGDHWHIQRTVPPGVYTAPAFRSLYEGDNAKKAISQRVNVRVFPNGTSTRIDPADMKAWCQ